MGKLRYNFSKGDLVIFPGACMYNEIKELKGVTAIVYEKSTDKLRVKRLYSLRPYKKKHQELERLKN